MNFADCLPNEIAYVGNIDGVRELRLRNFHPVRINVSGKWFWVGADKLQENAQMAVALSDVCDNFLRRACNSSVFAYEKMLAQGYFTLSDGARVGVCGVMGAKGVFQKYTSLCIRVPRYVACAADNFNASVIIAGPPGSGKTTYLRDFACKLSHSHNVAVVDERGEIACGEFLRRGFCDVFCFADKQYAFEVAVRTLAPDWLVTDELAPSDLPLLQNVTAAGVKLAASIHAANIEELKLRLGGSICCFKYAVLLNKGNFAQTVVKLDGL